jgi:hypothetical protein
LERKESAEYRVLRFVGLAGPEPKFFLPSVRLGAVPEKYKDKHFKRGQAFDANRYTKQEYLEAFTPDLLAFAKEQLNADLVRSLGYKILEATDPAAHRAESTSSR